MFRLLGSRKAFYVIIAFFSLESLYIALTARYPMAFDEYAHYGIAKLYTSSWSPFLSNVPDSASVYGAVARDPSFLYHYLLSFPLRLLELCSLSMTWQILILRFLNIGIAVVSLFIYRRLILKLQATGLIANGILLFFTLIPVVPLIAGQIT